MAVNKITNKQVVNKESVNRADHISTKNETIRGNRGTTLTPGHNYLQDIQTLNTTLWPLHIEVECHHYK